MTLESLLAEFYTQGNSLSMEDLLSANIFLAGNELSGGEIVREDDGSLSINLSSWR